MARKGKMFEKEIESSYLNETLTLRIYEPEKLDSLYETNVCIMHDGNDYYNIGRIATLSDELHDIYDIVNTIFVGIHYIDRFDRREKYHPDGKNNKAYTQFLIEEVMPVLDKIVPINPLGIIYSLMGDSLAGTLSFMIAVKRPDLFKNVIMQSPLVNDTVLDAAQQSTDINQIEIYHTIGLQETAVGTTVDGDLEFVEPNKALHTILSEKIRSYHYFEFEDGLHTWKYWQTDLPRALKTIFS